MADTQRMAAKEVVAIDAYKPLTAAPVALWAAAGRPMTGRPAPSLERVRALIPT
jgi:hypothetical protein